MPLALYALTAGAFGIGVTEFVIMGLLLDVSADFGVSIAAAGLLISGYALGVVVGAPVLTVLTSRWPRKTVLLALMAIFIAGNAGLCAGADLRLPHGGARADGVSSWHLLRCRICRCDGPRRRGSHGDGPGIGSVPLVAALFPAAAVGVAVLAMTIGRTSRAAFTNQTTGSNTHVH